MTYTELQKPPSAREESPLRTLETLERDFKAFQEKGKGDISVAKEYNNVIRQRMLDIPLDMVKAHAQENRLMLSPALNVDLPT